VHKIRSLFTIELDTLVVTQRCFANEHLESNLDDMPSGSPGRQSWKSNKKMHSPSNRVLPYSNLKPQRYAGMNSISTVKEVAQARRYCEASKIA
jgi:hypothetical protein